MTFTMHKYFSTEDPDFRNLTNLAGAAAACGGVLAVAGQGGRGRKRHRVQRSWTGPGRAAALRGPAQRRPAACARRQRAGTAARRLTGGGGARFGRGRGREGRGERGRAHQGLDLGEDGPEMGVRRRGGAPAGSVTAAGGFGDGGRRSGA